MQRQLWHLPTTGSDDEQLNLNTLNTLSESSVPNGMVMKIEDPEAGTRLPECGYDVRLH
jgi:hypothetical protein